MFAGMESWLPWLAEERTLVDDLALGGHLIVTDPSRALDRSRDLVKEEAELAAALAPTWVEKQGISAPSDSFRTTTTYDGFERLVTWKETKPGGFDSLAYAFDVATADKLQNPLVTGTGMPAPGPDMPTLPGDVAVRGDTLYNTYCATCHGVTGAGNGRVASRFVGVPSLLTDRARGYTDGYLYSIIRYGRGLMPKYGDKLPSPRDRWAIVNHLRALQGQVPAVATTGGAN